MPVNTGSLWTGGRVSAVKANWGKTILTNAVCTEVGGKIVGELGNTGVKKRHDDQANSR